MYMCLFVSDGPSKERWFVGLAGAMCMVCDACTSTYASNCSAWVLFSAETYSHILRIVITFPQKRSGLVAVVFRCLGNTFHKHLLAHPNDRSAMTHIPAYGYCVDCTYTMCTTNTALTAASS